MLQHAYTLEMCGHTCVLYIEGARRDGAAEEVRKMFGFEFEHVRYGWDDVHPADMVFATIWYSAAVVRNLPFPTRKAYFVQDYEAYFNPMGDAFLRAENSYRCGLTPVTIGRWLRHELESRFGAAGYHFDFGADLSVYRSLAESRRELAVCFIHQPDKPRRCARLGLEALAIAKHLVPELKVYLFGSREKGPAWLPHENLGLLSLEQCNALYNRCAVGLCLSSSNPSRIPFEMMAAGLPVVEVWRDNTLYDFPEEPMLLCEQTPESLAAGLVTLLRDPSLRQRKSAAGREFMKSRPLTNETEQFADAVSCILDGREPTPISQIDRMYRNSPVTVGDWYGALPMDLRRRLASPPNARVNALPPPIRKFAAWGARAARRMLDNR
ncbi:hypothetical protein [Burkholderia latens]|uniref:rhamnosyltransferase WsaF family glycosyltransferase n=1 Tax=Burkholderia latens TaxID=488446 RepID=UPI0039A469A1